jgi:mercuric reductase
MAKKYDFDVLIIGSGPAGFAALEAAADLGAKRIALVESYKRLGGECPNWGCIPTKSLLQTVDTVQHCAGGGIFGVKSCGGIPDFKAACMRQRQVVDMLTGRGRLEKIVKDLGVELLRGRAEFSGMNEVTVGNNRYTAKRIINAAGTRTFVPPIPGLDTVPYLTAEKVFELNQLPASVLVIGGGPIGVELSKIFAIFGVKATVVEMSDHILSHEDHEAAAIVADSLIKLGVKIVAGAKVGHVKKTRAGVCAHLDIKGGQPKRISAEALLVATGKQSRWPEMQAEKAGVMLDEHGYPQLTKYFRTTNPAVYAAGDATGHPMFTPVAHHEGPLAAYNAIKGDQKTIDLRVMPRGTYGDPELGSVGLTELEARRLKKQILVGRADFRILSKSLVTNEPIGMVKLVVDKKTREILGGHIVGHSAAELIHTVAVAMQGNLLVDDLAEMIYAFPTYAEAIGVAAASLE